MGGALVKLTESHRQAANSGNSRQFAEGQFILMRFVLRIQDIILVKAAPECKFCSLSGNARGNGNRDMTV